MSDEAYIILWIKSETANITINMQNWYKKWKYTLNPNIRPDEALDIPLNKMLDHKHHNKNIKWIRKSFVQGSSLFSNFLILI